MVITVLVIIVTSISLQLRKFVMINLISVKENSFVNIKKVPLAEDVAQ